SKLPSYQFTYKHDVFDQKKISAPQFQTNENYLAVSVSDFSGDRKQETAYWTSSRNLNDGYVSGARCYGRKPGTSQQLSLQYCDTKHQGSFWIHTIRDGLKKQRMPLFISSYKRCYTSGSGERDICKTYNTTQQGLYDRTARIADFDGDGQDDVISDEKQKLSRAVDQSWSNIKGSHIVDFNGDGRADLGSTDESKKIYARLSNGSSGFFRTFSIPKKNGTLFGDYNGDGLTDLLYVKGGHDRQIYFSTGLKFIEGPVIHSSSFGDVQSSASLVADVNGDGRADYIGNRKSDHTRLFLTRGDTLFHYYTEGHHDLIRNYPTAIMADADADGFIDFITHRKKSTFDFDGRATKLVSERPDMLVGVVLPSGGQLSASYTTYGGDAEDERWFPPVLTVLAALTEKPNSSQAFTTHFAYSGGRWDFDNRRFAGFKKIITTLPK
ncbi:FG-GAP-like repeat-containing protein, partial [Pseudovibrio denitrificans]